MNLSFRRIKFLVSCIICSVSLFSFRGFGVPREERILNLNGNGKGTSWEEILDVYAIAFDGKYVWFGTNEGVYRMDREAKEEKDKWRTYLPTCNIKKILVDDNRIWFGTLEGLWSYDKTEDSWRNYNHIESISEQTIYGLSVDERYLWVGTLGNGISCYDKREGKWNSFTTKDGLLSDVVYCITVDGDEVWFGTDKGVSVYNVKSKDWKRYTEWDGLACNSVGDIGVDREDVWFATLAGISRYNKRTKKWTSWTNYQPPLGRNKDVVIYNRVNAGSTSSISCVAVGKNYILFPYFAYDKNKQKWMDIFGERLNKDAMVKAVAVEENSESETALFWWSWGVNTRGVNFIEIKPEEFKELPQPEQVMDLTKMEFPPRSIDNKNIPLKFKKDAFTLLLLHLDEGSGVKTQDESIFQCKGEIEGATWAPLGKNDSGLYFDGANSLLSVSGMPSTKGMTSLTLEAWIYITEFRSSWAKIFFNRAYTLSILKDGSVSFAIGDGGKWIDSVQSSTRLSLNTWYHVAATWSSAEGKMKIWVNGKQDPNTKEIALEAINADNTDVSIGRLSKIEAFTGIIDEVRISNIVRYPSLPQFAEIGQISLPSQAGTEELKVSGRYDASGVQIKVACIEPNPTSREEKRDGRITEDSCVEILVTSNRSKGDYYRFACNSLGTKYDAKIDELGNEDISWNGNWDVKTSKTTGGWEADFNIPYRILNIPKQNPPSLVFGDRAILKINVIHRVGGKVSSPWKEMDTSTWMPLNEAVIDFDERPYAPITIMNKGNQSWGLNTLEIGLSQESINDLEKLILKVEKESSQEKKHIFIQPLAIVSKGNTKIPISYFVNEPGHHKLILTLLAENGSEIYYQDYFDFEVPELVKWAQFDRSFYTDEKTAYLLIILNNESITDEKYLEGMEFTISKRYLHEKEVTKIPLTSAKTKVPLNIAELKIGDHEYVVTLRDRNKNIPYNTTLLLHKYNKKKNEVKIDYFTGTLISEEKPFFPLGYWGVSGRYMADFGKFGFNALVTTFPSPLYNHIVDEYNMRYIPRLVQYRIDGYRETQQLFEETIKKNMEDPRILAWYSCDEPEVVGMARMPMARINEYIKHLDPYHPVFLNFLWLPFYRAESGYADSSDILGIDHYPTEPAKIIPYIDILKERSRYKPAWMWLRACHFGEGSRFPTPEETKCMTYLSIVKGITGLLYFRFFEPKMMVMQFGGLIHELRAIEHILISPDSEQKVDVEPSEGIHFLMKQYKNKNYLIVVNSDRTKKKVEFTFFDKIKNGTVEVILENRRIKTGENFFQDEFRPYEVHIYELTF